MLYGVIDVSFWQDPWGWIDENSGQHNIPRGVVNRLETAVTSLTLMDWVLLAVAAALIAWVWASLHAITRLGPIEVAALEHDGKEDDGVPVKALTAQLREALSRTGLSPPPAVPAGTPQINLIDAIKESPIPNANWIAAIVQLVPRPRPSEYHISGVLLGPEPPADNPPDDEPPDPESPDGQLESGPCGLRFAVVPAGDGTAELSTVRDCPTHSAAVISATSEMFLHISQDATGAFPIWARWHNKTSLEAFVNSWKLREGGDVQAAIDQLESAKREEPFNALADLQVANLYEKCEPEAPEQATDAAVKVLQSELRAHAVQRYLEVANAFPEVVEAHYRLAIAAGTLASILRKLAAEGIATPNVVGILSLEGADTADVLPDALWELANRECDCVLELLRPWWALARFRLRTQFEPKGYQRRVMRRAVRISRHCHGLRRLSRLDRTRRRVRAWIWLATRARSLLVHKVHLGIGFGTAGWQAHYNAACFDALLLEHFS